MIDKKNISDHLAKTKCYRCGSNLEDAGFTPINEVQVAFVAHVVCPKCQAESIVTVTHAGGGTLPVISDLMGDEYKKFLGLNSVNYDDILDLHQSLKKKPLWKLLQQKEKN